MFMEILRRPVEIKGGRLVGGTATLPDFCQVQVFPNWNK